MPKHTWQFDSYGNNSEMGNTPFPQKKQQFANSHLELNRYFHSIDTWNRDAIEMRSKRLADIALTIWPYFGEEPSKQKEFDLVGKTPKSVTILGQKYPVESWRDVEEYTMKVIAEMEPEWFAKLVSEYPRFISRDPSKFRKSRYIGNGFYIEVTLGAKDIYRFCTQAIASIGLSNEDWNVETE